MVKGKWYSMDADLSVPLSVRKQVFGVGRDALDAQCWQVVVFKEETAVGSARIWYQEGAFHIGSIGVLETYRGQGFGDLLIRLLLFKALSHSASLICAAVPKELAAFFEKYGFQGDENGKDIQIMSIRGECVQLSHCGGNCEGCTKRTEECIPKALR